MSLDLHQHLWTPELLEQLARRRRPPFVDITRGVTVVHAEGERPYVVDTRVENPATRRQLLDRDGLTGAVVALSSPIGIEALPRAGAVELIDSFLDGVEALPSGFLAWGPIALDELDIDDVDSLTGRGCVGISVPAGALAGPERLEALGPLLERAARRHMPLFVHPGRAPGQTADAATLTEPLWWRAMTDYVAQMQAAWFTFAAHGRRHHPGLVVVFAMLAGCAPVQAERFETRGGPSIDLCDPLTFYDTSSYGSRAIEAIAGIVGRAQLVFGSDRPVAEPVPSRHRLILQMQAERLVDRAHARAVA